MGDLNLFAGYALGSQLSAPVTSVPDALRDVNEVARLVDRIDCTLFVDDKLKADLIETGRLLQRMAVTAAPLMPEIGTSIEQLGVALRLWTGCIWAAKPLDRPDMTADWRAAIFSDIDQIALQDKIFRAGVESAPVLNALPNRNHLPPALDGVPETSAVRRHL